MGVVRALDNTCRFGIFAPLSSSGFAATTEIVIEIGRSSNGRAHGSGPWNQGSNPCLPVFLFILVQKQRVVKPRSSQVGGVVGWFLKRESGIGIKRFDVPKSSDPV